MLSDIRNNSFPLPHILKLTNVGGFSLGFRVVLAMYLSFFSATLLMVKSRLLHMGTRINLRGNGRG